MKAIVLSIVALCSFHLAFTQQEASREKSFSSIPPKEPIYVLKASDKQVVLDPSQGDIFDMNSLDISWIEKVEVMVDKHAVEAFGDKAANGVIIIYFKDYFILSKEVHLLFEPKN